MTGVSNRFPKSSRLHLRKEIEALFSDGKVMQQFPLRCHFRFVPLQDAPVKVVMSVPKKNFKKAADRNLIRRRMREAFRLNCHQSAAYFKSSGITLQLMFVYTGKVSPDYAGIESKIILILQRLADVHEKGVD